MKLHRFIASWAVLLVCAALLVGCASKRPESLDEAALRAFLQGQIDNPSETSGAPTRYSYALVSLDGKTQQVFVYVTGAYVCGTGGCNALILKPTRSSFEIVADLVAVILPVRVLPSKTNGWHDLGVWARFDAFGGNAVKRSFDGRIYPRSSAMLPVLSDITTYSEWKSAQSFGEEIPVKDMGELLYP